MKKKLKTYYLGQHIRYFLGRDNSLIDNWTAAFTFAQKVVLWAATMKIPLFSPAAYTIPLATRWLIDNQQQPRDIYFFLDKTITERLRAAGELIWVMPYNWAESEGCKKEIKEALDNNEQIIQFDPFFNKCEEIDLDLTEWLNCVPNCPKCPTCFKKCKSYFEYWQKVSEVMK